MVKSFCKTELNSSEKFEVENILTVGEVVDKFSIKCIEFSCQRIEKSALESTLEMAAETALLIHCPCGCKAKEPISKSS